MQSSGLCVHVSRYDYCTAPRFMASRAQHLAGNCHAGWPKQPHTLRLWGGGQGTRSPVAPGRGWATVSSLESKTYMSKSSWRLCWGEAVLRVKARSQALDCGIT